MGYNLLDATGKVDMTPQQETAMTDRRILDTMFSALSSSQRLDLAYELLAQEVTAGNVKFVVDGKPSRVRQFGTNHATKGQTILEFSLTTEAKQADD